MSQHDKLLHRILLGRSDANIPFSGLRALLVHMGFDDLFKAIFGKDMMIATNTLLKSHVHQQRPQT